jgi:hypothetical protein
MDHPVLSTTTELFVLSIIQSFRHKTFNSKSNYSFYSLVKSSYLSCKSSESNKCGLCSII